MALIYATSRNNALITVEELKTSVADHGPEYVDALVELVAAGYASPDVLNA